MPTWGHFACRFTNGPRGRPPAGPRPLQLRFQTLHIGEQYVSAEAWQPPHAYNNPAE